MNRGQKQSGVPAAGVSAPRTHPEALMQQPEAMAVYLQTLLEEVPDYRPSADTAGGVADCPETVVTVLAAEPSAPAESSTGIAASGKTLPDWQCQPFQALMLRLGDMRIGIPLTELHGIVACNRPLSHMPGQPVWQKGLWIERDEQIRVVDTARLMVAGDAGESDESASDHGFIVRIGRGHWGLFVDRVEATRDMDPAQIQWLENRKRPWIAGLDAEGMCSLLRVDELVAWLDAGAPDVA